MIESLKKSPLWQRARQDWFNLNTILAAAIYAIVAWGSLQILLEGTRRRHLENAFFLTWLVTLLPALIIVVAFGAYRGSYRGKAEGLRTDRRILAWRRYALHIAVLMSITTMFLAGFLYEDLVNSTEIREGQFAFGTFSFPIYVGQARIEIPSAVFWAAYIGYLITLLGVTLRRIVTNNLVPHFYLASSFRLIKSLVAAVLLVVAVTGMPQLLTEGFVTSASTAAEKAVALDPYFTLLIAFVAGATADDVIGWIVYRVRRALGRGVTEPLPLSLVQGIDPTLEAYLREEGVDSIQMLATASLDDLVSIAGLPRPTLADWQLQAEFLRTFDSAALAAKFLRLGINELADFQGVADDKLTKALAAANEKDDLKNADVHAVLLQVLRGEAERKGRIKTASPANAPRPIDKPETSTP
ncbi:MAG TPA: helix-hairpin-helix domain-containing protein [Anaerolineae bacterium]